MYTHRTNTTALCQSVATPEPDENVIHDLDAATIQIYEGNRIYRLDRERVTVRAPYGYWFGRVYLNLDDSLQCIGYLSQNYSTPEAALAALLEHYPEPGERSAYQSGR